MNAAPTFAAPWLGQPSMLLLPAPLKMMGKVAHTPSIAKPGSRQRSRFANDGSYASVELLLNSLARRCFSTVQKLQLSMSYEDVRQEMDEAYLRAFRAWQPDRGVKFVTYCQNVCLNNFRHRIEKMAAERTELGMFSYDSQSESLEDEVADPLERLVSTDCGERPEDRLMAQQEMRQRLRGMTPNAQRFITALILSQTTDKVGTGGARFSKVAAAVGLKGEELKRVKLEITQKTGFAEWQASAQVE